MEGIKRLVTITLITLTFAGRAQVWKPLTDGLNYTPLAVTVNQNMMYVAYAVEFNNQGGHVFGISVWNGSFWRDLPRFTADSLSTITCLKFYKESLYIGGKFKEVSGLTNARNLLKWNGKEYQSITPKPVVAPATFGLVTDLEVYDKKLLISGEFNEMQEIKSLNIAAWDGQKFVLPATNFGSGPNATVNDLEVVRDTLFIAGAFSMVSGETSKGIACWTGTGWITDKDNTNKVFKISYFKNRLYCYGQDSIKNKNLFYWVNGKKESADKAIEVMYNLFDMITVDSTLYACGSFDISGESGIQTIIALNNDYWRAIKGGTIINCRLIENYAGNLIAAGSFNFFGNLTLNRIAQYDEEGNFISGRIFYDKNSNCTFDNRDEILNDRYVIVTPGPFVLKPDDNGFYKAFLPKGKYTVQILPKKYWFVNTSCKNKYDIDLTGGTISTGLDFAMLLTPDINDVKITITNSGGWRTGRGQTNLYILAYENIGSNDIKKGRVAMVIKDQVSKIVTFPLPDSTGINRIYWNYENLLSGEIRKIAVYITIPDDYKENTLNLEADISSSQSESSTNDNTDSIKQQVNGFTSQAFGKQVYPSATYPDSICHISPQTDELVYTISFANFGTDTVRTVYVIDTLDLNIAMQYTQELGSSHAYTTRVVSGPPGSNLGILIWTFQNINLKPNPTKATDFIGDKGFISFKVKLNTNLGHGTLIKNKANIIYDLQDNNLTNAVYNQVDATLSVPEIVSDDKKYLHVYPNPFNTRLTLQLPENESFDLKITDITGKVVASEKVSGLTILQTEKWSKGIYVVSAISDKGTLSTFKAIKQ